MTPSRDINSVIAKIRGIPGNAPVLAKLEQRLKAKQCISFIGAGASADLYPLWHGLIDQLGDEATRLGLATEADRQYWYSKIDSDPQIVAMLIRNHLGNQRYAASLRRIFGYKTNSDGHHFTPLHSVLMRLPFRGYITTNYDPGLLEARLKYRPNVTATGFSTWKDQDSIQLWLTDDIYEDDPCPVLFAHGIYARTDTLILGEWQYRNAYSGGMYRRLFEKLWTQDHLVFIGFSFSDKWINFIGKSMNSLGELEIATEPRHIVMIGLRDDEPYSPDMRQHFAAAFNAEVVFYQIEAGAGDQSGIADHSALYWLLESLADPIPDVTITTTPRFNEQILTEHFAPQLWVHDSTEDHRYVVPTASQERFARWATDPKVRIITVTGMGGLGKTALVGYCLKHTEEFKNLNRPLFYWSFYAERNVKAFFDELLKFAVDYLGIQQPRQDARKADWTMTMLRTVAAILVLDGLEVLQQRPGTVAYGELLEDDLRDLLVTVCTRNHDCLVVLTSRFPFADLTSHLGRGLRSLELEFLTPDEGAALLEEYQVGADHAERRKISTHFEGHPLALRIAASLGVQLQRHTYDDLSQIVLNRSGLSEEDPLERKLRHLLTFYEENLPLVRSALLGVVALFRSPVSVEVIVTMAQRLPRMGLAFGPIDQNTLQSEIEHLRSEGLLIRESSSQNADRFDCHPVLRDHFRRVLLTRVSGIASEAATLLTEQPSAEPITQIGQLEPVVAAIEILIAGGDIRQANELYLRRLDDGRVFRGIPAVHEGLRCTLEFVADEQRRELLVGQLNPARLGAYLDGVGLFAQLAGESDLAIQFYGYAAEIHHAESNEQAVAKDLLNVADLLATLGQLDEATGLAKDALARADEVIDGKRLERTALSYLGNLLSLRGSISQALDSFEEANFLRRPTELELYGYSGILWCDLLIRTSQTARARELTDGNLEICTRRYWIDDAALCHWILARIDFTQGDIAAATNHLTVAESTVRSGHIWEYLPRILLAQADLARHGGKWEEAYGYAEEALNLASSRGMQIQHADALVMRGRISLDRARLDLSVDTLEAHIDPLRALDDGEAVLAIAKQSRYVWSEQDALNLAADAEETLGHADRASRRREEARAISNSLRWV